MRFDLLLPTVLFAITSAAVLLYPRSEKALKSLLKEKLRPRDAVILVIFMGLMVAVIALVPALAIQILFISSYSYVMFFFTYVILKNKYAALLPTVMFLAIYAISYLMFPRTTISLVITNLFAATFSIMITAYLGVLFSWKTMWIYASLLTVMDIVQVFGTGLMGAAAEKTISLQLPVAVILPTYPAGGAIGLGLGDIILSGLLAIQTAEKNGRRAGILATISIGVAMFVFEFASFNYAGFKYFPATVVVVAGWLLGMGVTCVLRKRVQRKGEEEKSGMDSRS